MLVAISSQNQVFPFASRVVSEMRTELRTTEKCRLQPLRRRGACVCLSQGAPEAPKMERIRRSERPIATKTEPGGRNGA